MKTIKEHLQDLPEPARSAALVNLWWEDQDNRYELQHRALLEAFNWSRSPEGWHYWNKVFLTVKHKEDGVTTKKDSGTTPAGPR